MTPMNTHHHAAAGTATAPLRIVRHADVLVTMDAARREIADGAVVMQGPAIAWVGATAELPAPYLDALRSGQAEAIDMHGHVVTPGLVNTHHHMYQSLTRACPRRRTPSCSAGSPTCTCCGRGSRPR
jgi:cytosine/adenosine deaminase-related metal-dependent hydrolase